MGGIAGLWLLCGFFFLPLSSTPFFHPLNPLTLEKKRWRVKEATLLLDYFLPIGGTELLETSLIFTVKTSHFFLEHDY